MTADTFTPLRTSPSGRVPLWLLIEDALADADPGAWSVADTGGAAHEPFVPEPRPPLTSPLRRHDASPRPAPTGRAARAGRWVLERAVVGLALTVLAVVAVAERADGGPAADGSQPR